MTVHNPLPDSMCVYVRGGKRGGAAPTTREHEESKGATIVSCTIVATVCGKLGKMTIIFDKN